MKCKTLLTAMLSFLVATGLAGAPITWASEPGEGVEVSAYIKAGANPIDQDLVNDPVFGEALAIYRWAFSNWGDPDPDTEENPPAAKAEAWADRFSHKVGAYVLVSAQCSNINASASADLTSTFRVVSDELPDGTPITVGVERRFSGTQDMQKEPPAQGIERAHGGVRASDPDGNFLVNDWGNFYVRSGYYGPGSSGDWYNAYHRGMDVDYVMNVNKISYFDYEVGKTFTVRISLDVEGVITSCMGIFEVDYLSSNSFELTALDPDTGQRLNNVHFATRPLADFQIDYPEESDAYQAAFKCRSNGEAENFLWDFGDGSTAHTPDAVHTYSEPGAYTVTLTVTGTEGSFSKTKNASFLPKPGDEPVNNEPAASQAEEASASSGGSCFVGVLSGNFF